MEPLWKEIGSMGAVRVAIVGVLSILALFLCVETISVVQNFGTSANPPTNTITVTGQGTATAIPDIANISFGASATAADVATAQTKINDVVKNALAGVKAAGVADADITTTSFNVSPHYVSKVCPPGVMCPNMDSTVSGYDVSENISVKIRDTSKVSAILADLAKANVSNVSGPDFTVDDTQVVQGQARAQAIQKAQADAQKLASQLGVHLGKIVSFSDNAGGGYPMYKAATSMGVTAEAVAPSVPVGQNTYTDNVSITYEIR